MIEILRLLNKAIEEAKQQIENEQKARADPDNKRPTKIEQIQKLKKDSSEVDNQIAVFQRTDPKKVEELQKQVKVAKDAANRWTDNLFELKDWVCNKNPNFTSNDLEKQFPILKDLDNIE